MADRRRTAKSVSKRRYGEARQKFRTKGRIPFHGVEKVCFPPSSPRTTIAKIGPEFSSVAPRGEYELREFEVTANGRSLSYPPCPSRLHHRGSWCHRGCRRGQTRPDRRALARRCL